MQMEEEVQAHVDAERAHVVTDGRVFWIIMLQPACRMNYTYIYMYIYRCTGTAYLHPTCCAAKRKPQGGDTYTQPRTQLSTWQPLSCLNSLLILEMKHSPSLFETDLGGVRLL